ncbi:MAG TPA: hypothetical protein VKA64_07990 [Gammaproteobacteria bacterium]|nr:hypothetical protein [Gammaproteobacteria bacterium]
MAIKSAWAARNGARILGESVQEAEKIKANRGRPGGSVKVGVRRPSLDAFDQAWDALAEGHPLDAFGLPGAVVAKKNRKSVVTTMGTKYTRAELANLAGSA